MHLTLLWLDDEMHYLNIEGSLYYYTGFSYRPTDPQP
jgi:hypothetical protein